MPPSLYLWNPDCKFFCSWYMSFLVWWLRTVFIVVDILSFFRNFHNSDKGASFSQKDYNFLLLYQQSTTLRFKSFMVSFSIQRITKLTCIHFQKRLEKVKRKAICYWNEHLSQKLVPEWLRYFCLSAFLF